MLKSSWIANPRFDLCWIIGPHFFSVLLVYFWSRTESPQYLPLWAWLLGVLFVDVAHVYATLFRTYLHKEGREKWSTLLLVLPILVFMIGFFVYQASGADLYWRILAYIAAFHFIRQQYGFYRIYSRKDRLPKFKRLLDEGTLYSVMLLPLGYWHTHLPRDFEWFVVGDFISLPQQIWKISLITCVALWVIYVATELYFSLKFNGFNLAKNMLITATAFSWMVGIIYFNGDFAFTLTNTLSHGIPYMALVMWTSRGETPKEKEKSAVAYVLPVLLSLILLWSLAYVEEGLWDRFVWHERELLFRPFSFLSSLGLSFGTSFWVAFLSVPQVTHYLLDGFIWKLRDSTTDLSSSLK